MSLVACPRCGAQFDVSSFAPGSTFVCGACKNTLQVPAAPAKPASSPTPVKAGAPALTKKPAMDRRRAGDAAGEARVEGRAERIRRQRESGEGEGAKKKNPLPLVLAAVGCLALLGGGFFLMRGKGEPKAGDGDGGTGAGAGGAGATAAKAPAPVQTGEKTYEQMNATERLAVLETKKREGTRTPGLVKETHAWLLAKGLREDARSHLAAGRASFPDDPWINETLGLVNRGADIRKAANDDVMLDAVPEEDPDLRYLLSFADQMKKDKTASWIPKDDSAKLDVALASLKEKAGRMSDPVYQRTKQEFDNVRLNPAFTGMEFSFESFRPYVVFAEKPGAAGQEKADKVVQTTGKVLTFLYARWLQFMKEELKLDPPRMEDLGDSRLKVFVFKSHESFKAWHIKNQIAYPGDFIAAYYQSGKDRMILMHLDAFDTGTIMHEATHQLIHFYARHFTQKDDDEIAKKEGQALTKVDYEDNRLRSAFFWFQEGIAEYFGGAVKDKENEGEWKIGALQKGRLNFYAFMKNQKPSKVWPVEDFLFLDQPGVYARARVKSGWTPGDDLVGLMYSEGWALTHYFLHGENGKWRTKFCAFMRSELCGKSGKVYLLQSFGLPTRSDDPKVQAFMKEVDEGFAKYVDGLLAQFGRGK